MRRPAGRLKAAVIGGGQNAAGSSKVGTGVMVRFAGWAAAIVVLAAGGTARAAEPPRPVTKASSDWTLTLGVEGRVLPAYEGDDGFILRPAPLFSLRRAGTPESFSAPRDGASVALVEFSGFHLGPTAKLRGPRKAGDSGDLAGLHDVDWTLELGLFAEYWPTQWLRTRAEARQGIGGHTGVVADLSADVVVPIAPQWTLSAGPRLTLATAAALDPYFGIAPSEVAASGLAAYTPGGGVRAVGAGTKLRYKITPQWASHAYVEYDRLTGGAASSPLVTRRGSVHQATFGAGVTYSFDIPGLW